MIIGIHGTPQIGTMQRVFPGGQPFAPPVDPALAATAPAVAAGRVRSAIEPLLKAGVDPMFSIKPWQDGTASGWAPYAAELVYMLANVLAIYPDRNIWFTVWHEWENNMPATQFRTLYSWWYGYIKDHITSPRLHMGTINMAYQWDPNITTPGVPGTAAAMVPSSLVDFYGIDVYSHVPVGSGGGLRDHHGFARWLSAVPDDSKVFLTERGFDLADADQVATLNSDYAFCRGPFVSPFMGYLVWNTNASGHTYVLGPQAEARLREIAAAEVAPPTLPAPPVTYTQAELDAAVAAAAAAARTEGMTAGVKAGSNVAYQDVATYATGRVQP